MQRIVVLVATLLSSLAITPSHADEPVVATGFEAPESATWDPVSEAWYVTNKGGLGFGEGLTRGFISKVSASGDVLAERWFGDVASPFGIDAYEGSLYVADGEILRIIPVDAPENQRVIVVPGSGGFNDVEVDAATGDVYLSASSANRIYRVRVEGETEIFLEGAPLDFPNGLLAEDGSLIVGTMGFSSGLQGALYRFDIETRALTWTSDTVGAIDGVVRHGTDLIVTDFVSGRVSRVLADGTVEPLLQLAPTAADLGIDAARGVVGIPETGANLTLFLAI